MITGRTTVAAVIGSPVGHSLSPAIHNAAFAAAGLDWAYAAFEVGPGRGAEAVTAMRVLGLGGLSVTMPHKADVLDEVDRTAATAQRLGAVNCIAWDGDTLVGHNTDGAGFLDALVAETGLDPSGSLVGVLGAGGAARAVVVALTGAGADRVVVVNRDRDRAGAVVAIAGDRATVGTTDDLAGVDLLVNATPVGMDGVSSPVAEEVLHDQVVVDLVYEPRETPLLAAARTRGLVACNGLGMLVHQAAHAFRLWTGVEPDLEAMSRAVAERNH